MQSYLNTVSTFFKIIIVTNLQIISPYSKFNKKLKKFRTYIHILIHIHVITALKDTPVAGCGGSHL
jgi:hypothetical protein